MKGLLQIALFLLLPVLGMAQCPNVPEICNNGIDDDCDGFIDCFDGDCANKTSCDDFYYGQGEPECTEIPVVNNNFALVEDWRSTVDVETRGTPIVGDLDGDGFPEVVTHYRDQNTVYILDGQDGSVKATINAHMSVYSQSPAIADVDGDGFAEIFLVQEDRTFSCYDHNGNPKTGFNPSKVGSGSTPDGGSNSMNPSFADFNGDGVVEIFMGNQIFDALTGTLVAEVSDVYNDSKGSVGKNSHAFSAAFDILPDGFCSDCSGPELICGNVVYSVNVNTHSLTEVSRAPSSVRDGKVSLADWDGDDKMDIIVTSSCCGTGGAIYIWNPRTQDFVTHDAAGNALANNPLDAQNPANTQVGLASIADFDGDGYLEMAMAGNNEFFVIDNDLTKKWSVPVQDVSNMTTSTAFDFEGDGKTEIIYRDETTLYVFDGSTGAVKASTQCGSATRTELPIVVDVDADGEAEIVCNCSDYNTAGKGNVRVYESDVNKWVPTRKVWNSHNYVPSFINDDLTIPLEFQNKALIDGQDLYLSQTTLISNTGGNIYPSLPDFVVEIDTVEFSDCSATEGTAKITICNEDFNALVFDFDITYYQGDPASGGTIIGAKYLTQDSVNVVSSRCMEVSFEVPAGDYDLFVVVNDDGSNAVQIPSVVIPECDSTNNIVSKTVEECKCLDTDEDGVCDVDDLDDDNDGILDKDECQTSNFYWSDAPSINGKKATGTINGVNYIYTSSINIESTSSIFSYSTFPASFNIPNIKVIKNRFESENTVTFAQPVENPILVFSSIGGATTVPIEFSNPVEVLFSSGPINVISPTELTGKEGYVVLRMNGTFTSISFDYLADENYVNFCFGADFLSYCDTDADGIPDYLDDDSDADGCIDAMEGNGNFGFSDVEDGELSGGVDVNGIPLQASGGQPGGTSTDDSKVSSACDQNYIQEDTLSICVGDSIQINATNIIVSEWQSAKDFTLISDSSIVAKPTASGMYYVTNFKKNQNLLINGDFEQPNFGGFKFVNDALVPGWTTTASDRTMEFWPDGMLSTPAFSGVQFVELNANMPAALYQDIATNPGDKLMWGFAHRGRDGVDQMDFEVGPPGGPYVKIGSFSDGKAWGEYSGVYEIPPGQNITRFYFTSTNGVASGNLLDNVEFTTLSETKDSIYVVVHELPKLDLGADTLICEDSSFTVQVEGNYDSYLWNTSATSSDLTIDTKGVYSLFVTDSNACEGRDTIEVSSEPCFSDLILTDTVEICYGDSSTIKAINIPNFNWFGDKGFTSLNDSSIRVSPDTTTWYYYGTSGGSTTGANIIVNGDFESGNSGFTSEYSLDCGSLTGEGKYCVGTNPRSTHNNFSACGDHTSGSGNMMIMNASTKGGVKVWCQNVPVDPGKDYEFSAWITSVHRSNPAVLEFQINGTLMGNTLNATTVTCSWDQYAAQWNSGVNTSIEICLVNQNTGGGGNDFAIDDIAFSPVNLTRGVTDSVLVIVNNTPIVDLGNDTTICDVDSILLEANINNVQYLWNGVDTASSILVNSQGENIIKVTNDKGCVGKDTVEVFVQNAPLFTISNDTIICRGDSILVSSRATNYDVIWNTGSTQYEIIVNSEGTYSVSVQDSIGCKSVDSMQVKVNELPIVALGNDTTICEGDELELNPQLAGLFYSWNTLATTQQIVVKDTGIYGVEVRDAIGCLGSDSMEVFREVILDPYFEKTKWFCQGDSVLLEPDPGFENYDIVWANDQFSSWINAADSGVYNSFVSGDYCSDTFAIEVTQVDTPDVSIVDLRGLETYCFDIESTTLKIVGENERDLTFEWDVDGSMDQTIEVMDSGVYWATVSNPKCKARIKETVTEYCKGKLFVPNSFSPNSDGVNDVFLPVSNGHLEGYELNIYDRWGVNIFTSNSIEIGWDGTVNNNTVQIDVYVYKIVYSSMSEFGSEKTENIVGTVTVLK